MQTPPLSPLPINTCETPVLASAHAAPARAEAPRNIQNVEFLQTSAENAPRAENAEFGETSAEKPSPCKNAEYLNSSAEKDGRQFVRVHSQLLALQRTLAFGGFVRSYWKNYRGQRLGPYYRLVFRHNGRRRSIYLGSSSPLADRVRRLLDEWQHPRRQKLYLRKLKARARAALRQELAKTRVLLAPLGYRMKGTFIHRIKTR
jgi:hypothetical protein